MTVCSARGLRLACILVVLEISSTGFAQLVNSEWNTGSGNWNVATNWFPNDVPDNGGGLTYDVEIGNRPVAANAAVVLIPEDGVSDTISSLTMSGGADLQTNGNALFVTGQTTISGIGSSIFVEPATGGGVAFNTDNLDINLTSALQMAGGTVDVDVLLEVNSGSITGHGLIIVGDADGVVEVALENSANIFVGNTANAVLTLQANGVDTIDLDGTTETGTLDVANVNANAGFDTLTLVVDGPLADAFSGTLLVGQRDTVTFNDNFTMSGADVQFDGGTQTATMNGPAEVTSIASSAFTITGDAIISNDLTFSGAGNSVTINFNSSLTLSGTVNLPPASFNFASSAAELIVTGLFNSNVVGDDFNWDGPGTAATTISGGGQMILNVDHIDTGNDTYGGTLNLNDNADLSVNNTANLWTLAGTINKNNAGSSTVAGDTVNVTGAIAVNDGSLTMPVTILNPSASVVASGTLVLGAGSEFAGPSSVTGTGTLRMASTSTVTANTTVGVATFDWDGTSAGSLHTINTGVVFTINSTTFDSDGDMDDPISLAGSGGQLNVNGVTNWTMAAALTTNPAAVGTATIGGTSRMTLAGAGASWTVTGNTTASAPVTFGSSATTIAAARTLRLAGGDNNLNTHVMAGGTIGGAGTLAANDARELRGFGNIGATIDFDNTARLRADDGTLTISGSILDVGVIGTADSDGVLNVTNAWNNSVAAGVALLGGTVQGGTITNDTAQGIQGFGTVTSRVINNTQLLSFNGGTLIFQTAANDNDWDGAVGTGLLRASAGTTLDLRDAGGAFQFGGTVQVEAGARVFVNNPDDLASGFAFDFLAASDLNLNGGTYEATASTDLEGTTTVAAGPDSTIKVRNNTFLSFRPTSATTLNGNLRTVNNNINIDAGATFSGAGAIIVPDGSHMVADNLANIGVLLDMQGGFRPGNSEGIGRVDLFDYQHADTAELFVELTGTALNAFDRLVASGDVVLDGYLNIDIDGLFVPVLGQTFNIITGNTVTGAFDYKDVSGMPAGLAFRLNYLANAVQLEVVTKPIYAADFDDDGDVDLTDYNIWKGAFGLNQLGDANGDNISDASDYTIWRDTNGSVPGAAVVNAAAVPEPAAWVILALGLLLGVRSSKSNRR